MHICINYGHWDGFFIGGVIAGLVGLIFTSSQFLLYLIALPGLIAHELSHYLVALSLGAHPEPIDLRIRKVANIWTLGSVTFKAAWWSAGLVAVAPLFMLPAEIAWAVHLAPGSTDIWRGVLGYCCVVCIRMALPSVPDWIIALRYPVGALLALLIVFFELQWVQQLIMCKQAVL